MEERFFMVAFFQKLSSVGYFSSIGGLEGWRQISPTESAARRWPLVTNTSFPAKPVPKQFEPKGRELLCKKRPKYLWLLCDSKKRFSTKSSWRDFLLWILRGCWRVLNILATLTALLPSWSARSWRSKADICSAPFRSFLKDVPSTWWVKVVSQGYRVNDLLRPKNSAKNRQNYQRFAPKVGSGAEGYA